MSVPVRMTSCDGLAGLVLPREDIPPREEGRLPSSREGGRCENSREEGRLAISRDRGRLVISREGGRCVISRDEGRFAFSREGGRLGDVGRSIMSSWLIGSWLAVIWFVNPFVIVRLDISGLMAAEGSTLNEPSLRLLIL